MTCMLFELALHRDVATKLQKEVDEYYSQHEGPDHHALSKLPYLQAAINETLRLYPGVPSGVQRKTPPKGLQVGHTFIPGDTVVQVPLYTLFRGEHYIPDPTMQEGWE